MQYNIIVSMLVSYNIEANSFEEAIEIMDSTELPSWYMEWSSDITDITDENWKEYHIGKLYYALHDDQVGRYLQTGINSRSKQQLLKEFIDYVSIDFDSQMLDKEAEAKYLELAGWDYTKALCLYYYDTHKSFPETYRSQYDYTLEQQSKPFEEE